MRTTILSLLLLAACSDAPEEVGSNAIAPGPADLSPDASTDGGEASFLREVEGEAAPQTETAGPESRYPDAYDEELAQRSPVEAMFALVREIRGRPEHDADVIRTRHILVGVRGGPGVMTQRSLPEAEKYTAAILHDLKQGRSWAELEPRVNDETEPTVKLITKGKPTRGAVRLDQLPRGFRNIAWRLEPGEIGVVPYSKRNAPYGFYVIRREL